MLEPDGKLRLHGSNVPSHTEQFTNLIESQNKSFAQFDKYSQPNYFVSFQLLQGITSAAEWQKNGIPIEVLNKQMIYPQYGVFPPTSQEHLKLLDLWLQEIKNPGKVENVIDLGCGTGVLSVIANKYGLGG